jgi:hypothetical protein
LAAVEFNDADALASADEATTPMEASDNVSASNFFMFFPFPKLAGRNHNAFIASGRRAALLSQTLIQSKGLQLLVLRKAFFQCGGLLLRGIPRAEFRID